MKTDFAAASHNDQSTRVRSFAPADMPAVAALIDATGLFPSSLLPAMVAPFFAGKAPDEHWVVLDHSGPVAVAYWSPERMTQGTWNLLLIAVHPQHQRQGLGASLLAHVEQHLASSAQRLLLVETSGLPEFEATRAFYRACCYDEEARIRDYYAAGEDKVVFRKALRGPAHDLA
jgi:GNAT superfamily N-acetyltransferase